MWDQCVTSRTGERETNGAYRFIVKYAPDQGKHHKLPHYWVVDTYGAPRFSDGRNGITVPWVVSCFDEEDDAHKEKKFLDTLVRPNGHHITAAIAKFRLRLHRRLRKRCSGPPLPESIGVDRYTREGISVTLSPRERWKLVGDVMAGQKIVHYDHYEQTWCPRPCYSWDVRNNVTAAGYINQLANREFELPGAPVGALIGSINGGNPFLIGNESIALPESGLLRLSSNNSLHNAAKQHYAHGSGFLILYVR